MQPSLVESEVENEVEGGFIESEEGHPQRWWILGVLCLSLILVVAGNSAMNVALPTIVRELGATQTELQWIVDAYSLVFAGLLLPAGALGDRFGRKRALQLGLVIFGLSSIAASLAHTADQIILARAVMGSGGALIMPSTLSLLAVAFPPSQRGRAIAIWAGFAGAGGALGPVISGIVLEHYSWASVFWINIPIIVLALVVGAVLVPSSRDVQHQKFDAVGAVLSMVGLTGFLYGIIEGPEQGWTHPLTLIGFTLGILFLVGFVLWEQHASEPMIDLRWFRIRSFSTGVAAIVLAFFAFMSVVFVITQYYQFVLGYSPLIAGLAQLPQPFMMLLVSPNSARLAERYGSRRVVAVGLFLMFVGLAYLGLIAGLETPYLLIAPGLMILGTSIALSSAPSTTLVLTSLPVSKAGVGSAVNDVTREFGASMGVAIMGSILTSVYQQGLHAASLPAELIEQAQESIGAALQLAQEVNAETGDLLNHAARQAFTDGFRTALLVGASIALIASFLVLRYGPIKLKSSQ